jgi:nucleoside-diphosphate-sugar epimerase/intein/homing endonuclease
MPTSLVTGGAGFLGSHLCEALLQRGHRVICLDNLETGSLANIEHLRGDAFAFLPQDLTHHVDIAERIDFVYHLASPASPIDYLRLPLQTLKVGSHGTHNALGIAKVHRSRFLLASTSEVYGDPQVHPQPETYWGHVNPIGPRGVYDEAKRYAEALTMAYHRQQGVDTAIVRIFNSILEDEQILVDDGRELRRMTVGEYASELVPYVVAAGFVPSAAPRSLALLDHAPLASFEYPLAGVTVPAFDEDGRMIVAATSSLVAHPTASPCYEISTRYGRSIRVTGDHSLFVEGPDGSPKAREASDLVPGDRVAIAGRVRVPERDRESVSVIDAWSWVENDPWELVVEAEGLGTLAWEHRYDLFGLLVSERRNNGPNWRNGAWTKLIRMRATNRIPLPVLRRLGVEVPEGARVKRNAPGRNVSLPASVGITDSLLWLLGLWVAEGSWHRRPGDAFITLACDESRLDRAERIVRDELGLHVVRVGATRERVGSMYVHSGLLLRLLDYLGFTDGAKCIPGWVLGLPLHRLKWFVEGYREGDGVHSGAKLDAGRRHEFSTVSARLKDDLIVALGRFGLVPSVGRYESTLRGKTGARRYPFWRLTLARVSPWSPLEWDAGVKQVLNARTTGDLVWAKVTDVREIDATPMVYDFSVPGHENFWAGTGVMAHNTYGARMRPHDGRAIPTFMRQALEEKPLTVFGDGSQTRSFCYVDDLIRGLVLLAESGEHMPVNIGNPTEMTLLELAEAVVAATSSSSPIVFEALPVDDPQVRQPDITRARQLLGWEPEVALDEGLRRTLASLGRDPARA